MDFSNKNLQKASFRNKDLSNSSFSGSDIRGADFSGSNLSGADLTHVKTGITPLHTLLIFIAALLVSFFSGYIAMLTGQTIQRMLHSKDGYIQAAGIVALIMNVLFILYAYFKGGGNAIRNLILPATLIALILGFISLLTGVGTGIGMVALVLTNILVVAMFIVGTIARAVAGTLSSTILFIVVAIGGGMFGKSVGGGIGTVIMAISCLQISKKALSGAKGFEALRKVTDMITRKFGTSFRMARLAHANFSDSKIYNTDFTNANISSVNWGNSKKVNCLTNEKKTA